MSEEKSVGQPEKDWVPQTDAGKNLVRLELERILHDPLFQASKRYTNFLRYVVDKTLEGQREQLKERILGIEVFGRNSDYDSAQDNVVRATATEIRKRLGQYYEHVSETREVRIELIAGSYVPKFFKQLPAVEPNRKRYWSRYSLGLIAVLILGLAGAAGWWVSHRPADPVTLFWQPFFDSKNPIPVCIGSYEDQLMLASRSESDFGPASQPETQRPNSAVIRLSNAMDLARFGAFLGSKGKRFQMHDVPSTTIHYLGSGPAMIIGTNEWAIRLTAPLRFSLKWEPSTQTLGISDRMQPSRQDWVSRLGTTGNNPSEDYGLISRFLDPTTGQWVIVAAGLRRFGTSACLDFLSNSEEIKQLAEKAPQGWNKQNLQLIIATRVIESGSGRPRIIESYFW